VVVEVETELMLETNLHLLLVVLVVVLQDNQETQEALVVVKQYRVPSKVEQVELEVLTKDPAAVEAEVLMVEQVVALVEVVLQDNPDTPAAVVPDTFIRVL
jgi:hypothetical protein